jgi:hypothetical protein
MSGLAIIGSPLFENSFKVVQARMIHYRAEPLARHSVRSAPLEQ